MKPDPLVEEGRAAARAYIDSFKGDSAALRADLQRRSDEEGHKTVSRPPKKVARRRKKAG